MDNIGPRIRQLREARNMTQRDLAARVGCTPAYISLLENNKVDPSLSMLKKITSCLDITIVDFFRKGTEEKIVVHKEEREIASFTKSKTTIEMLVTNPRVRKMDARLATIHPSGGSRGTYRHEGEEFGFILEGELELFCNGKKMLLKEGDSFYFRSTLEHRFRNPGKNKCVVLWVNHPPSF
ncbi:MAG: cupin domain-containing protein [Deltaproteobacteria bacterium]|nr:cupin domain-containing protein [Deltaproteobacteria bacterium]HDM10833.1 cupin domain-containing protein [Desulfobacteraceae bacterium]